MLNSPQLYSRMNLAHNKHCSPDFGGSKVSQNKANHFAYFRSDESGVF